MGVLYCGRPVSWVMDGVPSCVGHAQALERKEKNSQVRHWLASGVYMKGAKSCRVAKACVSEAE